MRTYHRGDEKRLDLLDLRAVEHTRPLLGLLRRYFRYRIVGLENIPAEGPALIAMNHGAFPVDVPLLGGEIYERDGRVPRSLADRLIFKTPIFRDLAVNMGAVVACHETAERLLDEGNLVIVMPGGAAEAFKSSNDAYRLYWRQRRGFAELAIRTQVPIVPAACIGIDDLFEIPWDMFEAGKRFLGLRSFPLGIVWGIGPGIPRRVPLTQHVGDPIFPSVPSEAADDEQAVLAFRDQVVEAMEDLMNEGIRTRAEETIRHRMDEPGA